MPESKKYKPVEKTEPIEKMYLDMYYRLKNSFDGCRSFNNPTSPLYTSYTIIKDMSKMSDIDRVIIGLNLGEDKEIDVMHHINLVRKHEEEAKKPPDMPDPMHTTDFRNYPSISTKIALKRIQDRKKLALIVIEFRCICNKRIGLIERELLKRAEASGSYV